MFSWPLLLVICFFFDRTVPKKEDIKWFFLVGFLGIYLNQLFFTVGIKLAGAILAAVLQLAAPPIAAVLAILFRAETFSIVKVRNAEFCSRLTFLNFGHFVVFQLGGIVLAVAGAIILVGPSELSVSSDRTMGIVVLLLQAVWIGLFLIFQKKYLVGYSPLTITTGIYMSGAPFITLTALVFVRDGSEWIPNTQGIGAVVYAVVAHSIVGYLILSFANRNTQSSIVAAMNCLQVPLVAILASFVTSETFDGKDAVGTLIIICGLGVISYQRYKEQQETNAAAALAAAEAAKLAAIEPAPQVPPIQTAPEKKIRVAVVKGEDDDDDDEVVELEDVDIGSELDSRQSVAPAT